MPMMITTQDKMVSRLLLNRERILAERKKELYRQVHPYRPFSEIMEDGAWARQRCFILGGGPSLARFDFGRLKDRGRIIAVNRAFEYTPFSDILFFMDQRFYKMLHAGRLGPDAQKKWAEFQGHKVFLNILGRQHEDVYSVKSLGRIGLSNSLAKGIYHGNNSGVGALGLAICLRANPIYLLGFDFKFDAGKSHFHSGYKFPMKEGVVRSFIRDFERVNRFLVKTNFKIVNLNPDSALRCFPFSTIDEVLGNGK
jgi:hypothetical protein